MAAKPKLGVYSYEIISQITGLSMNAISSHVTRGSFDFNDLESVVLFIARHADPELRLKIMAAMTERNRTYVNPTLKKKQKAAKARRKKTDEKVVISKAERLTSEQTKKKPTKKSKKGK